MSMSMASRREYHQVMHRRYRAARTKAERSALADELVKNLGYHRKHALRVLAKPPSTKRRKSIRPLRYQEAQPAISLIWQALDFACAERLHPVLLPMAEHLAKHGELVLTEQIRRQLDTISRATLARRLARLPCPKTRRYAHKPPAASKLLKQIPIEAYPWNEARPGALEVDLVEHNGGSTSGHYAYTLDVVDVVTGWSRRRAVLGRSQKAVFEALDYIIGSWPMKPWALHSDNGSEFINDHLYRYTKLHQLKFTRSEPYRKNDNAHVEQRNRQFVREVIGYERYETQAEVIWLNQIYSTLDQYANLFLPTMKLIGKTRRGSKVQRRFDQAQTPLVRLTSVGALAQNAQDYLLQLRESINPLRLRQQLEEMIVAGATAPSNLAVAAEH